MTTLSVTDLCKTYTIRNGLRFSKLEAVKKVDFDLEPGRTVALVGQSGSGKSTIAKLLSQLERPTSGTITLDGKPIGTRGKALERYRDEVQMVFQDPPSPPSTRSTASATTSSGRSCCTARPPART